jgi:hypothetical protein
MAKRRRWAWGLAAALLGDDGWEHCSLGHLPPRALEAFALAGLSYA